MKEKERLLDKNNMILRLEKKTMSQVGENQMPRNELSKKKSLQERGITLIALVVTIIILLILSGVTLNIALSDNGLFSKTQEAADKYKKAQEDEELEIEKIEYAAEGKDITKVETISDKQGFEDFRDEVNKGEKNFENTLIKLSSDLDLENEVWKPIGTKENSFKGVFNGNGYKIKNLKLSTVDEEYKDDDERLFIGLFGYNEGIIRNVRIESGAIDSSTNDKYTAGMVAGLSSGIVEMCCNEGDVTLGNIFAFGGIVGKIKGNSRVIKCCNLGNITSDDGKESRLNAGIVGDGSKIGNQEIYQCYNYGDISCNQISINNVQIGGICSQLFGIVDSCYNKGNITLDCTEGSLHRYPACAGIVGQTNSDFGQNIAIRNCYNVGSIIVEIETAVTGVLRKGSLVAYCTQGNEILNNHCFTPDNLSWYGEFYGEIDEERDVKTYETKESMKGIAKQLGKNYKDDTNEINEGYPILTWQ